MNTFAFTKLIVNNLEASTAYYKTVFDLKQLQRITVTVGGDQIDEIVLGSGQPGAAALIMFKYLDGRPATTGETILGFVTDDLDGLVGRMVKHGGKATMPNHVLADGSGRVCFVTDPEGHLVELFEPKAS